MLQRRPYRRPGVYPIAHVRLQSESRNVAAMLINNWVGGLQLADSQPPVEQQATRSLQKRQVCTQ
jgi:hypothetical protein